MSDEFPSPIPRRKLEITLDDLDAPAAAPPAAAARFPPVAGYPPPKPPDAAPPRSNAGYAPPPPNHQHAPPPPPYPPPGYPPPQQQYPPPPPQYAAGSNPGVAAVALALNHKSPGVAVLLSLLLTGAGQIYCGKAGRGIAFFCAGVFAWVTLFFLIGFILLPAVWIWAAVDAASLAKRQNAMLMATVTGQPYAG